MLPGPDSTPPDFCGSFTISSGTPFPQTKGIPSCRHNPSSPNSSKPPRIRVPGNLPLRETQHMSSSPSPSQNAPSQSSTSTAPSQQDADIHKSSSQQQDTSTLPYNFRKSTRQAHEKSPSSPKRRSPRMTASIQKPPQRTMSKLHPAHHRNIHLENYSIQELFECFKVETLNLLIMRLIRYTDEYYSRVNSKKGETIVKSLAMTRRVLKKEPDEAKDSAAEETKSEEDTSPSPAYTHIQKQSFEDKISFLNRNIWKQGTELFISQVLLAQDLLTPIFDHLKAHPQTTHYFDVITDFHDEVLHRSQIRDIISDSKSILTFLRYLSLDLLNQICEKMGFREESDDVNQIVESLQEEILLLGLRLVINLLPAETLRNDVYPQLNDIPDRQEHPSARYLSKKEVVANILGLCFPYYPLEYKKRIEEAKKNRPALDANIQVNDILLHYTSSELSEFCKDHGLKNTGTKREKAARIREHFGDESGKSAEGADNDAGESDADTQTNTMKPTTRVVRRTPIKTRKRKRQPAESETTAEATPQVEQQQEPRPRTSTTTRRKRRRISIAPGK